MGKKISCVWKYQGNQIIESPECLTIKQMVENDLEKIATREGGWVKLFKHKSTGEFWELDFPQSEMHGGGPPVLENLTNTEVQERYNIDKL